MKHKHAELMRLYSEDAMETDKPWKRWQHKDGFEWHDCVYPIAFFDDAQYRCKAKTIIVNGIEVPAPETDKPKRGTIYYYPTFDEDWVDWTHWDNVDFDNSMLNNGVLYLNKEDAMARAKAMLEVVK